MKNKGLKWVRGYPFWISTALIAVTSFLYYPVLLGLADDWWNDPDYSHGLLIPFISLYFVWGRRVTLQNLSHRPDLDVFVCYGLDFRYGN